MLPKGDIIIHNGERYYHWINVVGLQIVGLIGGASVATTVIILYLWLNIDK